MSLNNFPALYSCFVKLRTCFFIAAHVLTPAAFAMPSIDKPAALTSLATGFRSVIFADTDDPNLFYLPYTRIQLTRLENGSPAFSFAYTDRGALLTGEMVAVADTEALATQIAELKRIRPLARFKPLPIKSGTYVTALRTENKIDGGFVGDAPEGIAQDFPEFPIQASFYFPRTLADRIVLALNGGAAFGINYRYVFDAATAPSAARIKIDWNQAHSFLVRETAGMGGITLPGVVQLLQKMQQNRTVEIIVEGTAEVSDALLFHLARTMTQACFAKDEMNAGEIAEFATYTPRSSGCSLNESEFIVQVPRVQTFVAQAGFQLGGMCTTSPQNFGFILPSGAIQQGCPDRIYGTGTPPMPIVVAPQPTNPEVPAPLF
jgi:hypothetical protein